MGNLLSRKKHHSKKHGKSKNQQKAPEVTPHDQAVLDLKVQRDKLKEYQKRIGVVIERETAIAKEHLKAEKRNLAILALKKKKYQEGLLEKTENQLLNLEQLVTNIEFAQVQKEVFDGLAAGNVVLEQLNKETSLEDVEKLMADTADAIAYQEEISQMLSGKLTSEDESELLDELAQLQKQEAEEVELRMPSAPATEPKAETIETLAEKDNSEAEMISEAAPVAIAIAEEVPVIKNKASSSAANSEKDLSEQKSLKASSKEELQEKAPDTISQKETVPEVVESVESIKSEKQGFQHTAEAAVVVATVDENEKTAETTSVKEGDSEKIKSDSNLSNQEEEKTFAEVVAASPEAAGTEENVIAAEPPREIVSEVVDEVKSEKNNSASDLSETKNSAEIKSKSISKASLPLSKSASKASLPLSKGSSKASLPLSKSSSKNDLQSTVVASEETVGKADDQSEPVLIENSGANENSDAVDEKNNGANVEDSKGSDASSGVASFSTPILNSPEAIKDESFSKMVGEALSSTLEEENKRSIPQAD